MSLMVAMPARRHNVGARVIAAVLASDLVLCSALEQINVLWPDAKAHCEWQAPLTVEPHVAIAVVAASALRTEGVFSVIANLCCRHRVPLL
jgi:hypothetical protein